MASPRAAPVWARAQGDTRGLRRGAWYRVTAVSEDAVLLDVNRAVVSVPASQLDTVTGRPPHRWSVVPRPHDAPRLPLAWGERYAVCPACRTRAAIRGHPFSMRCPRCAETFPLGWDELDASPDRGAARDAVWPPHYPGAPATPAA
jgi:hypothetical protein